MSNIIISDSNLLISKKHKTKHVNKIVTHAKENKQEVALSSSQIYIPKVEEDKKYKIKIVNTEKSSDEYYIASHNP
jgi:hypothetical protein